MPVSNLLTSYLLLVALLGSASLLPAQLGNWSHRIPILIDNSSGPTFAAGAYRIAVNTQAPIALGIMEADGRDIRIADSCGAEAIPFWIEDHINTDSTVIWLRLPGILTGDSLDVFLYHGNPNASSNSNFNSTFPNVYRTQGNNDTLSGLHVYDWFEVEVGDTLFLDPGLVLNLKAAKVLIDGIVMGDGAGYSPPAGLNMPGNGPGGGQPSFNAGSGGGGYGGSGGLGGYDFADSPGAGGSAYGTRTGVDLDIGSSGASSPIRMGGAGGGAITANGFDIVVGGAVYCRGDDAQQPGGAQGAGGGAGGGIYFESRRLELTGGLFTTGGAGSAGLMSGNDDGGGGSGGRIKLFWEDGFYNGQGTIEVDGGVGGPNGSFAKGEDGEIGSLLDTLQIYPAPYYAAGLSQPSPLPADPDLIPLPDPVCEDEPISFSMPSGYDNFQFYLNGPLVQDSSLASFSPGVLEAGDMVAVIGSFGACLLRDTVIVQTVVAPQVEIVASDSPACLGDTVILDVGTGWNSISWNAGGNGQTFEANFSGVFIATVTDANNCTAKDTYTVNLGALPFPSINPSGLPACSGDPVGLSTSQSYPGYLWSNGATGPNTVVFSSGIVSVTVTGTNGCKASTSTTISYDTLPFPQISQSNDTLYTQIGYVSYRWLWNGSPLIGATNYFYKPTFNGNYSVQVEGLNGCEGTSSSTYVLVGMEEPEEAFLQLVPNPSRGKFRLEGHWPEASAPELLVYNSIGTLVSRVQPVDLGQLSMELSSLGSGVYWLIVRGKEHVERKKFMILQ